MQIEQIKELVRNMTLEEKAGLCSGENFWNTKEVERLNIQKIMLSDGPHGLRKQDAQADHLGVNESIKAVCFPAGCMTAASFDRELLTAVGEALGEECQAEGVGVLLGPAVNIKRSPLCGRNFEYYSEDPYVASEIANAFIKGVQSKKVGTSIKHFLANNQEHRRMTSSSEVDERTLREIYLAAFEGAVKSGKPWTVMCSYNKINGTYASENPVYLTDILRKEWGFDGCVVSDWGAVNNRVLGLSAGMDLEMPGSGGINDALIVEAVKNGELEEIVLNETCVRILDVTYRYLENKDKSAVFDLDKDHALARKAAEESIVLLKNEENILPVSKERKIAFIGEFAKKPRYQGGGSSHINSFKVTSAMESLSKLGFEYVTYEQGYQTQKDETIEELKQEAVRAAKDAEVAVIFAGLPDNFESEGYDRKHMHLPNCQNELIEEICDIQPNTIVVLHNGSPVEMPWIHKVKGLVEAYLGGQAIGEAVVNVLYGKVNPSGRLPETFPVRLEDNPSYLFFQGESDVVEYREGVFVGYRYYESKKAEVQFPFGYGLSYTQFAYSNMNVDKNSINDTETIKVSVDVTNTGTVTGKEVVQLYVSPALGNILRPVIELRGFEKIQLEPNETKTVTFTLDKRSFAYWNTAIHDWHVLSGKYTIHIGKSVRELVLSSSVTIESTTVIPVRYDFNSTLGDIMKNPRGKAILEAAQAQMFAGTQAKEMEETAQDSSGAINDEMMQATMEAMPLRQMLSFIPGMKREMLQQLIDALNNNQC
jgi:beta-glucosidase